REAQGTFSQLPLSSGGALRCSRVAPTIAALGTFSKAQLLEVADYYHLEVTELKGRKKREVFDSLLTSLMELQVLSDGTHIGKATPAVLPPSLSREKVSLAQKEDKSLSFLFERVSSGSSAEYAIDQGLLLRKYSPPEKSDVAGPVTQAPDSWTADKYAWVRDRPNAWGHMELSGPVWEATTPGGAH
ncbi:hypothetical protein D4764_20G0006380, partial [Takifugu flavidus]